MAVADDIFSAVMTWQVMSTSDPGGTINTNSTEIGNASGQSFSNGEDIRMDLLTDLIAPVDNSSPFTGGLHHNVSSFKQEVLLKGNAANVAVFTLAIYLADNDLVQADDIQRTDFDATDVVIYDENMDVVVSGTQGLLVTDDGVGNVTLSGVKDNWTYEITTDSDREFNAVELTAGAGDNFKLGSFSFGENTDGQAIELTVTLEGEDGDGDLSSGTLSATLYHKENGHTVLDGKDSADDTLIAPNDGSDYYILGYGGDDTLTGSNGNDILYGGQGNDVMAGGGGSDEFLWIEKDYDSNLLQEDTISDFVVGVNGDLLNIEEILPSNDETAAELDQYMAFSDNGSGGTLLSIDSDGAGPGTVALTIDLQSVSFATLPAGDQAIIQKLLDDGNLATDS